MTAEQQMNRGGSIMSLVIRVLFLATILVTLLQHFGVDVKVIPKINVQELTWMAGAYWLVK